MSESPGWFIVCLKCGEGERDGYVLQPAKIHDFDLDRNGFGPVSAVHFTENDDGEIVYECPTPPQSSPQDPPPRAEP